MTLSVRSLARRAVTVPFTVATTALSAGIGIARRLPLDNAAQTAGRLKDLVRHEYETLTERGLGTVAKLRGSEHKTGAEAAAEVEAVLDPFTLPEPVADLVDEAAPGATLAHDELPLEDYDHLTIGSLRTRIRRLDAPALIQLRDYERAHGNRLPVVMAFDNRLKTIAAETPGAEQATLVTV